MAKAATVHNPTNFDPATYEVEDYLDNQRPPYCGGDPDAHRQEVDWWEREMERTLGSDWRAKKNHCVHCGNGSVRWITAVRHKPTDTVVVFGAVCTARLGFADKHAFKLAQLQARAEARKVRFTIYIKRQEFLAAHPEIADALTRVGEPVHAKNTFVQDVLRKLDQYGSLSDAQVSAVIKSMQRDVEFAARKAAEATEPKGAAPSGRVEVSGVVLSTKLVENAFGSTLKMLVKLTNNSKVWVTVPSCETVERGDEVTFKATFEVSKDDASFAFGKRPTLVSRKAAVSA